MIKLGGNPWKMPLGAQHQLQAVSLKSVWLSHKKHYTKYPIQGALFQDHASNHVVQIRKLKTNLLMASPKGLLSLPLI